MKNIREARTDLEKTPDCALIRRDRPAQPGRTIISARERTKVANEFTDALQVRRALLKRSQNLSSLHDEDLVRSAGSDSIGPFFSLRHRPNENQLLDDLSHAAERRGAGLRATSSSRVRVAADDHVATRSTSALMNAGVVRVGSLSRRTFGGSNRDTAALTVASASRVSISDQRNLSLNTRRVSSIIA
jgi:hypothetical protein